MQLSFRHFFPAVKIRKAVNAIQYVGKLVPGGQFDILLQYLPFLLFIASVKNIVEVVASHMDLEQLHMLLQVILRIGFVSQRLDKFFPERSRPRYSVHFCHRI